MKSKEVKDLIIINLVWIIAFIIISFVCSDVLYKEYNKELITNNSNIVGNLINKYPELENDIIASLDSNENYEIGYNTLEKYGLTNDVSKLKTSIVKTNLGLVITGLISLFVINNLFVRKCYNKTDKINEYMKKVLTGDYLINANEYCESDISNLKDSASKMAIMLKEQSDMLQKEKQYLSELLEDIAHQIKTPLSGMYMMNDILENDNEEQIKKDFIKRNKKQINRIEWLISSLLKLSQLDSGNVILKREKIKISSLISKSIEPLKDVIKTNNINVKLNIRNVDVEVDSKWTSEAILNIIKNACEHTKNEIIIESTTNPMYTEIKIIDNGNGVNKEDLPYIFERFYKGSNKDSIGIGLNMSKKIFEMQHGTVDVEVTDKTAFIIKLYRSN